MQKRVWLIVVMIVVLIASMALAVACDTKDKDPIDDGGSGIIDDGGNNGGDNSGDNGGNNGGEENDFVDVSQYLTYQLNEDEQSYMVTGLTQEGYNLVKMIDNGESIRKTVKCKLTIPSQYQGKPVISIASGDSETAPFAYCSGLTFIVIPEGITSIGEFAFHFCLGLTSITIPHSVTSIGNWAFATCFSLIEVYNKSSLDIVVGSEYNGGVGYFAKNVYIQEGGSKLSTVEDGYVIYTDGVDKMLVKYVGNKNTLNLPDGITEIYLGAFAYDMSITNVVISDNVKSIGVNAFADCSSLLSVNIPNSVTNIGDGAFYKCKNLSSVNIPESVTSIGDGAFVSCSNLTSITIPDSVTSISAGAFSGCSSLTSITIPDSVTSLGWCAFSGCSSLININYQGSIAQWNDINKENQWDYDTDEYNIHCTDGDIVKE